MGHLRISGAGRAPEDRYDSPHKEIVSPGKWFKGLKAGQDKWGCDVQYSLDFFTLRLRYFIRAILECLVGYSHRFKWGFNFLFKTLSIERIY